MTAASAASVADGVPTGFGLLVVAGAAAVLLWVALRRLAREYEEGTPAHRVLTELVARREWAGGPRTGPVPRRHRAGGARPAPARRR
ncbi:hypothetical protein ADL22_21875 [Streptomyces sp. NRRL F-4489]|uniref:hypothetical protein n=1 Tax=Streptomyces sp. NRRL F-4489 TaxID=1609095 RepID=UPI000747EF65|nr:hypothetical protein [Streptomyces sp. NRRL F-4489]KUL37320.1 hypothetical protein ADL22_21875 [Streptomyces sp. NRRL F-4489]